QIERLRRHGDIGDAARGRGVASCQRCHAPLAEQMPSLPAPSGKRGASVANPAYDQEVQLQGVTCAACHVRAWRRLGPPRAPGSLLLELAGYPMTELAIFERSDMCLPCHQLAPRNGPADRPLLDTYREWLLG